MAGGGSLAEVQAWQIGEDEDDDKDEVADDDYESLFEGATWESEKP